VAPWGRWEQTGARDLTGLKGRLGFMVWMERTVPVDSLVRRVTTGREATMERTARRCLAHKVRRVSQGPPDRRDNRALRASPDPWGSLERQGQLG